MAGEHPTTSLRSSVSSALFGAVLARTLPMFFWRSRRNQPPAETAQTGRAKSVQLLLFFYGSAHLQAVESLLLKKAGHASPFLLDNFAPVDAELSRDDLPVSGELPLCLDGAHRVFFGVNPRPRTPPPPSA